MPTTGTKSQLVLEFPCKIPKRIKSINPPENVWPIVI